MRGGDLKGAYLVTRGDKTYPVSIKTPERYYVSPSMCIHAVGNCYGCPMSGRTFSIELDGIIFLYGYTATSWDGKLFYKWKNYKIIAMTLDGLEIKKIFQNGSIY